MVPGPAQIAGATALAALSFLLGGVHYRPVEPASALVALDGKEESVALRQPPVPEVRSRQGRRRRRPRRKERQRRVLDSVDRTSAGSWGWVFGILVGSSLTAAAAALRERLTKARPQQLTELAPQFSRAALGRSPRRPQVHPAPPRVSLPSSVDVPASVVLAGLQEFSR